MSFSRHLNASRIRIAVVSRFLWITIGLLFVVGPVNSFAQNLNCTLIVPANPLSAQGLATPYQLTATNPQQGACAESNANSGAFVQGVFIDPNSGQISVYNPLVINQGSFPGSFLTPPQLPQGAVVALFFGFQGSNLVLQFQGGNNANCVQGFGQEAWCNAPAFFQAANTAIGEGRLQVPQLGTGRDGLPCPTVRSFRLIDQDQSDNVETQYVLLGNGLIAPSTAANRARGTIISNASDNGLLSFFVDPALGCTPWMVPNVQDGGTPVPSIATDELQAAAFQAAPVAVIPAGDPDTFNPALTGTPNPGKVSTYRVNVDQPQGASSDTTAYCSNMRTTQSNDMLIRDRNFLVGAQSPMPDVANNLFTFLAQRYVASYQILNCAGLLGTPVNVTLTTDGNGVVIDAQVAAPGNNGGGTVGKCVVGYAITASWPGGFTAALTIQNAGTAPLSNWTLNWNFANGQTVSTLWNGVVSQNGAAVTVNNASYNASIAAGATLTGIGFNGTWNNATNSIPASISLNGTACTVN